jgi:photosynthetic reaction center H subunit
MADIKAVPVDGYNGSPLIPTGDPMLDGVGPAAWADRADVPDLTAHGEAKIVPMRVAPSFTIAGGDPDPRGLPVKAADGASATTRSPSRAAGSTSCCPPRTCSGRTSASGATTT